MAPDKLDDLFRDNTIPGIFCAVIKSHRESLRFSLVIFSAEWCLHRFPHISWTTDIRYKLSARPSTQNRVSTDGCVMYTRVHFSVRQARVTSCTVTHLYRHARKHAHTRTRTHTHTHAHAHIHTHTHTLAHTHISEHDLGRDRFCLTENLTDYLCDNLWEYRYNVIRTLSML